MKKIVFLLITLMFTSNIVNAEMKKVIKPTITKKVVTEPSTTAKKVIKPTIVSKVVTTPTVTAEKTLSVKKVVTSSTVTTRITSTRK